MLEYTYNGAVRKITINNTCRVNYTLIGGGGGGGGFDSAAGASGISGSRVGGYINANAGDVFYLAVGEGGVPGGSYRGNQTGGRGGGSLVGYSGGRGGNSGPWGSSGAGGGGGGATVLYKQTSNDNQLDFRTIIAVAAGGGGGGGGGNRVDATTGYTYGQPAWNKIPSTYADAGSNGNWGALMNNYAVWDFSSYGYIQPRFSWAVEAPYSGYYTLRFSADDSGQFYLNGYGPLVSTPGNYGTYKEIQFHAWRGLNILTAYIENTYGGAVGVAAQILDSNSTQIWNTFTATNAHLAKGMGGQGQNHRYDGGGGGGGGGGYVGGRGGYVAGQAGYSHHVLGVAYGNNDWGGERGSHGTNYISTPQNSVGAGGGSMASSYGTGGVAAGFGSGGYAAFSLEESTVTTTSTEFVQALSTRQDSSWNRVKDVFIMQNNQWKKSDVLTKINGEWVTVHGDKIIYSTTNQESTANVINDYSQSFSAASWGEVPFVAEPPPPAAPFSGWDIA